MDTALKYFESLSTECFFYLLYFLMWQTLQERSFYLLKSVAKSSRNEKVWKPNDHSRNQLKHDLPVEQRASCYVCHLIKHNELCQFGEGNFFVCPIPTKETWNVQKPGGQFGCKPGNTAFPKAVHLTSNSRFNSVPAAKKQGCAWTNKHLGFLKLKVIRAHCCCCPAFLEWCANPCRWWSHGCWHLEPFGRETRPCR